jgi:creatinine amidohydrolase
MSMHRWAELTREEVSDLAARSVAVLPIAAIEQHGPHLPTVTDTALVTAVVDRALVGELGELEVLLAPVLCFGASDHHLPLGGTLSLSARTFSRVILDLIRSAATAGCQRILVVNGHGGNAAACALAAAEAVLTLQVLVATCSYWDLIDAPSEVHRYPGHAGQFETALMLAVHPELVRLDRARPSPHAMPVHRRGLTVGSPDLWHLIDGFSDNPTTATAQLGERLLEACATAVRAAIAEVAGA